MAKAAEVGAGTKQHKARLTDLSTGVEGGARLALPSPLTQACWMGRDRTVGFRQFHSASFRQPSLSDPWRPGHEANYLAENLKTVVER